MCIMHLSSSCASYGVVCLLNLFLFRARDCANLGVRRIHCGKNDLLMFDEIVWSKFLELASVIAAVSCCNFVLCEEPDLEFVVFVVACLF